jgi:hypothetical protein
MRVLNSREGRFAMTRLRRLGWHFTWQGRPASSKSTATDIVLCMSKLRREHDVPPRHCAEPRAIRDC